MNEVTFHPVDMAWMSRLFWSKLEGVNDPGAQKSLFDLADQVTNIKMAATALANELGPNEAAIFAAENRPFFILEEDPNAVAGDIEALMASDTLDEIMSIMAGKAGKVYPAKNTMNLEDIVERSGLQMRLGALDVDSVDKFFKGLGGTFEEAAPKKTRMGLNERLPGADAEFAAALSTAIGRVAVKVAPAWYVQGAGLSMLYDLKTMKDFRELCGTPAADFPWVVEKIPTLENVMPRSFGGGCCAGVFIPASNVKAVIRMLEDCRYDITKELEAKKVPRKAIGALVKSVIEVGTYAARHNMAISEQNDLAESLMER